MFKWFWTIFSLRAPGIGIPIANEKTMGPDRALQFAGVTLDTELMGARLPEEKLDQCLSHHVRLTKESKYDLQVWLNFLRS